MSGGGVPGFTAASAQAALRSACAMVGLVDHDARLLRLGENALFHLPTAGIVVRVARSLDYRTDAAKEVDVAHWLAEHRFPAARVHNVPQPITADGHPVTFWEFISGRPGDRRDVQDLGSLLRRLHSIQPPTTFSLPRQNTVGRIEQRIATANVPDEDKRFLMDRLAEIEAAIPRLRYHLSPAPAHGDAHVKNLMIAGDRAILIDFERFSWGQPEWDLAMTATEYRTAKWWTDEEYASFVAAYGYDIITWTEGFDVLRATMELGMSTWLMQNIAESPDIAAEYQLRMRTLRGDDSAPWTPF